MFFKLPRWIAPHTYSNKRFDDLSEHEISDLKDRLSGFTSTDPEVSVVIPAWNEENTLFKTLSSLSSNQTSYRVEIIVINNNSTDRTQEILDRLGVRSFLEKQQGITFARETGLEKARGRYHLCADSDTLYPPAWIDLMIKPLTADDKTVGVYGRYSFLPETNKDLFWLYLYEKITGLLIRVRRINREFVNVLGFNMGFITEAGRHNGGFRVKEVRKFDNGPNNFVEESEDGTMALNLLKSGRLKLVSDPKARVFTSSRRLLSEGGIGNAFLSRLSLHSRRMFEYISGR